MENTYSKDFFADGKNTFQEIMEGENPQYTIPERLSSCFHVLTSMINDPKVPEQLKSRILSMWKETMENNANKMLPEHIAQNDKYLSDMILNIDEAGTNVNILDLASSHEERYDMMNSVKNQILSNDFNTVIAAMKSYSHVNDDVFGIANPTEEFDDFGSISEDASSVEVKNPNSVNHKDIIDNLSDEEQQIMLNNFIATNDFIKDAKQDPELKEDWAEEFRALPDDFSAEINKIAMLAEQHLKTLPKIDANSDNKPKFTEIDDDGKKEPTSQSEYNVDIIDDARRQREELMDNNNLIKKISIRDSAPLITSKIYSYDPDIYDPNDMFNNLGRGPALMTVNNITGTSTIPPASFTKPEAFKIAMLNLVEKGKKDVYLTPPKKGGASAQKQFLQQAITAAVETGNFDPENIHVPKQWKKYKNSLIESLQGAKISDEMSKEDMNHNYAKDNELNYDETPEIDEDFNIEDEKVEMQAKDPEVPANSKSDSLAPETPQPSMQNEPPQYDEESLVEQQQNPVGAAVMNDALYDFQMRMPLDHETPDENNMAADDVIIPNLDAVAMDSNDVDFVNNFQQDSMDAIQEDIADITQQAEVDEQNDNNKKGKRKRSSNNQLRPS